MAARASLFLLIVFLRVPIASEIRDQWIVWNVGQGQWVTLVKESSCWHFDMGGERAAWSSIAQNCRSKINFAHFSHWDADHIGFASRATRWLPDFCRLNWPAGKATFKKERMMSTIPECRTRRPFPTWDDQKANTTNASSAVVTWRGLLLPGDSPKSAERAWSSYLPVRQARVLVLGHHGSRTATSVLLVRRLESLRMAVSSARERRYGHPHLETELTLRKFHVPLLRTEDWGNIHFWQ